jgi:glutathione peroxidase
MMDKVEVNGANAHPLFQWLKTQAPGLLGSEGIKWNFTKFLLNRQGEVVKRYAPLDKPASLAQDIAAVLKQG